MKQNNTKVFVFIICSIIAFVFILFKKEPFTKNNTSAIAIISEEELNESASPLADKTQSAETETSRSVTALDNTSKTKLTDPLSPSEPSAAEALAEKAKAVGESEFNRLFGNKIQNVFLFPVALNLTEKQFNGMNEVVKKHATILESKILEMESVLTEKQIQDRTDVLIRSAFDNDDDAQRSEAIIKSLKLTDEQTSKLIELEQEYANLQSQARKEMLHNLNAGQKAGFPHDWAL